MLVDASEIINGYWKILKIRINIKSILTKFSDQRLQRVNFGSSNMPKLEYRSKQKKIQLDCYDSEQVYLFGSICLQPSVDTFHLLQIVRLVTIIKNKYTCIYFYLQLKVKASKYF